LAGGVYLRGCEGAPIQRVVVGAEADHKIWYVCLQVSVRMIKLAVAGRWVKEGLGLGMRARNAKARRLGGSLAIWWKRAQHSIGVWGAVYADRE